MKKVFTKATALLLALTMVCSVGQPALASIAIGSELLERTVYLTGGVTYTDNSLWSASRADLRTEHYATYTPGHGAVPMIYSGDYVASRTTVQDAAKKLEEQGFRVLAGINGGYFNTDGTIVGMLLTDGVIRALDVDNYALLGFTGEGGVFVDEGELTKSVSWIGPDGSQIQTELTGFNAYRNQNYLDGIYLYNKEFSSKVSSASPNVSVLLRPVDGGELTMNGSLALEVTAVNDATREGAVFQGEIPEGCYMLYAQEEAGEAMLEQLRTMAVGQQVTVSVSGGSQQWEDAVYGISVMTVLVREGKAVSGLSTAGEPRTALGVKEDGSVVLYTIDGRQSGYSVGAGNNQVADRLIELGCVTAVALDGGGSTTMGVTLPGTEGFALVNRPSAGQRRVNNAIFLVTEQQATGVLNGVHVDGDSRLVLAGGVLTVGAAAYDTAGCSLQLDGMTWSAQGGQITGQGPEATYTAGTLGGEYVISASLGGVQGSLPIRVIDSLSSLTVTREGNSIPVNSLILSPNETVELSAAGEWYNLDVSFADENVSWTVEGDVGTIDETGRFTAVNDNGEGKILARAGNQTVTIEVKVDRGDPFTDMAGHWSQPYVTQLYKLGITKGFGQEDGTYIYNPRGEMSRGELLVFLTRLLGVDTDLYEDVELPFTDAESIPGWMLPSVKAMYTLQVFQGAGGGEGLTASVNDKVTREAAMTMMGRVVAASVECDLSAFADGGTVSGWASPYVQTLVALGVVEGSGGYIRPKENIDRAAAAKLLVEIYDLEKAELTPRIVEEPPEEQTEELPVE